MQTLKILVAGAFSSGKTALIKSLSEIEVISTERLGRSDAVSTDHEPITIAFDFGRLTLSDEILMYFFGNPGARSLTTALTYISESIPLSELNFVVLINSAQPEFDRESAGVLKIIQDQNRPYVVALSRQDLPTARTPLHIRNLLSIPDDIKILIYDWQDPRTIKQVVIELLSIMPQDDLVQQAIVGLKEQIEQSR